MRTAAVTRIPAAEHILLESDVQQVPDLRAARKVHASVAFRSRLRGQFTQLEIIDYYYLAVRARSRSGTLEYVLDLRFVETPCVSRHIAWRWITASLLLTTLACGILQLASSAPQWWQRYSVPLCATVMGAWAMTTLLAAYRTTETVRLLSSVGAARVLDCTGGLGTVRRLRHFMAKVAAHVRLAAAARRTTKAAHLRDEMREHGRLRQIGVLDEPQYESAKARILSKHSPAAAASIG
ncbi:MAG TPA: hypothetical protein VMT66_15055 [Steroidobacteraceae bacterium]|nr:hypothetical protein [Steroidobacteraceae bacterium]